MMIRRPRKSHLGVFIQTYRPGHKKRRWRAEYGCILVEAWGSDARLKIPTTLRAGADASRTEPMRDLQSGRRHTVWLRAGTPWMNTPASSCHSPHPLAPAFPKPQAFQGPLRGLP